MHYYVIVILYSSMTWQRTKCYFLFYIKPVIHVFTMLVASETCVVIYLDRWQTNSMSLTIFQQILSNLQWKCFCQLLSNAFQIQSSHNLYLLSKEQNGRYVIYVTTPLSFHPILFLPPGILTFKKKGKLQTTRLRFSPITDGAPDIVEIK